VLSVLPPDTHAQLDLAYRLFSFAHSQRVRQLEAEGRQLRDALVQKQNDAVVLERRLKAAEISVRELTDRSKRDQEETQKLQAEKCALIDTVKKLNRDVSKLEGLKRHILQSLHEEDQAVRLGASTSSEVDLAGERLVSNVLSLASTPGAQSSSGHLMTPSLSNGNMDAASGILGAGLSVSRLSTPSLCSDPPGGMYSPSAFSPSAPNRIDGKEFFRQARGRLPYEQFSQFLKNIKELNHGRQTREETLRRARDIFGIANIDLYNSFEGLLSRHLPSL
ncbi:unnamed protein product, partial [Ostreobium quekettii]